MAATTPTRIASVRAFNRFYTRRLGMLGSGLLGTGHPLPQARVIYELGQRPTTAAADLRATLDLDGGYLSRLLAGLQSEGLVARRPSAADARRQEVNLTAAGTPPSPSSTPAPGRRSRSSSSGSLTPTSAASSPPCTPSRTPGTRPRAALGHAPRAPARRHRLGHPAPRRAL